MDSFLSNRFIVAEDLNEVCMAYLRGNLSKKEVEIFLVDNDQYVEEAELNRLIDIGMNELMRQKLLEK